MKKKKSILRSRFFKQSLLILIAMGGISYFLFFSGFFQIRKIIVSGEQKVSEKDIGSLIEPGNIFFINTEKIKKDILEKFPQIAELEIHRGFPDALNVSVVERLGKAIWCEDENCFLLDKEGVIFEEAPSESELIKISGEKDYLNAEKIVQLLEIQEKLKKELGITTTQAFIASKERLNVATSEGWEIYFNLSGDLNWQLQELGLILEKQITPVKRRTLEYIDLRFSRVYYR